MDRTPVPFSLPADPLLALASPLARQSVQLLYVAHRVEIDADGARTVHRWSATRPGTPEAAMQSGVLAAAFHPAAQRQPTLKARVLRRNGTELWLDPAGILVRDAPVRAPFVFDTLKFCAAQLPGVEAGCIVESQVTTQEHRPRFPAGRYDAYPLPVGGSMRLEFVVPEGLELRFRFRGTEGTVQRQTTDGRTTHTVEVAGLAEAPEHYGDEPDEDSLWPVVEVCSGTWEAIADAYAAMLAPALQDPPEHWVEHVRSAGDEAAQIAAAVQIASTEIRYAGVALEDAPLLPYPGKVVAERGWGDCKDQSALVVALLRAVGVSAAVVPLPSSTWAGREATLAAVANALGVPVCDVLRWERAPNARQGTLLNNDQRQENVKDCMGVSGPVPAGRVLLVDDYAGSSATLREAARALKQGGHAGPFVPLTVARVRWRLGRPGIV